MKKIAVLVSGQGTNLKELIKAVKQKEISNAVISVVISSNEKAKAIEIAENENIKTITINRKNFNTSEEYHEQMLKTLLDENPDLIVLAGFLQIISKKIIDHFENRIINIHPSLIPSFCGAGKWGVKVHEDVLKKGVKITGATVHFVNEKADDGPIIIQKSVEVKQDDTPEILQDRVKKEAEWQILKKAVDLFCSDKIVVKDNKTFIKE